MYILAVGYPLGVKVSPDGKRNLYAIENQKGILDLEIEEFNLWISIENLGLKNDLPAPEAILKSLGLKKAILQSDDLMDLFMKAFTYIPVRQGFGYVKDDKFSLVLGREILYPTKIQMDIWYNSDGQRNILSIIKMLSKEIDMLKEENKLQFIKQLAGLMEYNFLFLK